MPRTEEKPVVEKPESNESAQESADMMVREQFIKLRKSLRKIACCKLK